MRSSLQHSRTSLLAMANVQGIPYSGLLMKIDGFPGEYHCLHVRVVLLCAAVFLTPLDSSLLIL